MGAPDFSISRPLERPKLRVLSLGAGVQSSTLALMAHRGDLPKPDVAIFADTGWEPEKVYAYLDWLTAEVAPSFPVVRVQRPGPDLGEFVLEVARGEREKSFTPPFFTADPNGMLPAQCSKEFKTRVVQTEIRRMLEIPPKARGPKEKAVEQWLGISTDEIERMKDSEVPWFHNRWPLIEMRMNRGDCISWLERRQYPIPPKSSCVFCPMRDARAWLRMKDDEPQDFARAVAFDVAVRTLPHVDGKIFVHRQRVPLDEISFANLGVDQGDLFIECEGVCGV